MKITLPFAVTFLLFLSMAPTQILSQCQNNEVILNTNSAQFAEEMSYELLDEDDNIVFSFQGNSNFTTHIDTLCLDDGCYLLKSYDSYGDGWNGGSLNLSWSGDSITIALLDGFEGFQYFGINQTDCVPAVTGCTDPSSYNYNPLASEDDGSCLNLEDLLYLQQWDTLSAGGPKDNRINFVVQNRGVNNPDDNFESLEDMVDALGETFLPAFDISSGSAKTPYAQYKNFFNIYAAYWEDAPTQEEWWSFDIIKNLRDEVFLPWSNDETGWATWFSITQFGGGGGAGLNREERVGDGLIFGAGWETLLHEFGHTMPGLLDEYSASGEWSNGQCWETGNTTGNTVRDEIPWRKWIDPEAPLPTPYTGEYENSIGAFEGAMTNYFGCHRPTAKGCYMGAGGFGEGYGQDLCSPCAQRTVCFLYKYVNVIENPLPEEQNLNVTGTETITFSADVLAPQPNTQKYEWFLNGKRIASNTTSIDVTFGNCPSYELKLAVTDTTELVRYDEKFDEFYPKPYKEHIWNIEQEDVDTYDLAVSTEVTNTDCSGDANGSITLNPTMGLAGYSFWIAGEEVQNPITNLSAGSYNVVIADENNCSIEAIVNVNADEILDVNICSVFEEGTGWNVSATSENENTADIILNWPDGSSDWAVFGLDDGTYELTASLNGCSVVIPFALEYTGTELSASVDKYPSSTEASNGAIYVDVEGGEPNYHIQWFEKLMADQTDDNLDQISTSGTTWGHEPEMAFDNDLNTKWLHTVSNDAWIGYQFEEATTVAYYTITSADDVPERDPLDWVFQGSNDGLNWDDLDTRLGEHFPQRKQQRRFSIAQPSLYSYYRLYVNSSAGENQIQLQELEFIAVDPSAPFEYNPIFDDVFSRTGLAPGAYKYEIWDESTSCAEDQILISLFDAFTTDDIEVVKLNNCSVGIGNFDPDYEYYWLSDEIGSAILGSGPTFTPPYKGNFYAASAQKETNLLSSNRKGFAITKPTTPDVEEVEAGILGVVDPKENEIYLWYRESDCGAPSIHVGETYEPGEIDADFYVAALSTQTFPDPIDPTTIPGLKLRMDAADLDGDGFIDVPAPPTGSLYDWKFSTGQEWSQGNWFALRGNYQNGLGIADFATIWLQGMNENVSGFQTVIMAYKENALSWAETAPMQAISSLMPRHSDDSQLYSSTAPATTLNGSTYLNGQLVDPLNTANPMEFCVLGSVFTEPSSNGIFYTDVHWEGKVGEMLVYETALTDEEMKGVSEFLRRKWIAKADLESNRRKITWDGVSVSVHEIDAEDKSISIYPNPTTQLISISSTDKMLGKIELFDASGKIVKSTTAETAQYEMNLSELNAGTYFLKVAKTVQLVIKL